MRGVTFECGWVCLLKDISTHTPHARRDDVSCTCFQQPRISTHTPHARRDIRIVHGFFTIKISTHTPHARRDFHLQGNRLFLSKFQLTRLMRGVTAVVVNCQRDCAFQLTRLMRGVT